MAAEPADIRDPSSQAVESSPGPQDRARSQTARTLAPLLPARPTPSVSSRKVFAARSAAGGRFS